MNCVCQAKSFLPVCKRSHLHYKATSAIFYVKVRLLSSTKLSSHNYFINKYRRVGSQTLAFFFIFFEFFFRKIFKRKTPCDIFFCGKNRASRRTDVSEAFKYKFLSEKYRIYRKTTGDCRILRLRMVEISLFRGKNSGIYVFCTWHGNCLCICADERRLCSGRAKKIKRSIEK